MRKTHTLTIGCLPMFVIAAVVCFVFSGCIMSPRQLAGPDCGRNACSPCPPPGMHHPLMHCPQLKGNPYVVYPPSGGTVSITPWGSSPESE